MVRDLSADCQAFSLNMKFGNSVLPLWSLLTLTLASFSSQVDCKGCESHPQDLSPGFCESYFVTDKGSYHWPLPRCAFVILPRIPNCQPQYSRRKLRQHPFPTIPQHLPLLQGQPPSIETPVCAHRRYRHKRDHQR